MSGAILRFLGKLPNSQNISNFSDFYPKCPILSAKIDAILDQEVDTFLPYRALKYKDNNGFKEMSLETANHYKKVINQEFIPLGFQKLSNLLKESKTGWLAGTKGPSIADFQWVGILMAVQRGWSTDDTVLDGFPELNDLVGRFLELPSMKEYYKDREYKGWW